MKTARLTLGLALVATVAMPVGAHAQRQVTIEVSGGGGITVVDVQKASGQTSEVRGEEKGTYQYFGRVFFADLGPARFGVEVGYQYLYFYEAPYIGYLDRDIDAMRYAAVLRFSAPGSVVFETGAGVYSFDGGSVFSALGAAGLDFALTDKVSIPIRARADIVLDDALTIPVGATLGLSIRLN